MYEKCKKNNKTAAVKQCNEGSANKMAIYILAQPSSTKWACQYNKVTCNDDLMIPDPVKLWEGVSSKKN